MVMRGSAAARPLDPQISDDAPVLRAILAAPVKDMPETEQEQRDMAEARALGRFVPGVEVSRAIAARLPR